jgi:hypothetical protein
MGVEKINFLNRKQSQNNWHSTINNLANGCIVSCSSVLLFLILSAGVVGVSM